MSGRHALVATQVRHPWRATLRTVFQAVVALAAGLPVILQVAGVHGTVAGVSTALAVAAVITRLMASPVVESFLQQFLPWLSAAPSPAAEKRATAKGEARSLSR